MTWRTDIPNFRLSFIETTNPRLDPHFDCAVITILLNNTEYCQFLELEYLVKVCLSTSHARAEQNKNCRTCRNTLLAQCFLTALLARTRNFHRANEYRSFQRRDSTWRIFHSQSMISSRQPLHWRRRIVQKVDGRGDRTSIEFGPVVRHEERNYCWSNSSPSSWREFENEFSENSSPVLWKLQVGMVSRRINFFKLMTQLSRAKSESHVCIY